MSSGLDNVQSFISLQNATRTGLWRANINSRTMIISSFLMELLGLDSEILTFDQFGARLDPSQHKQIVESLYGLTSFPGNYEEVFSMQTQKGFVPVRVKISKREVNAQGEVFVEGSLQCLDDSEIISKEPDTVQAHLNQLLSWQKTITQNLLGLLNDSIDTGVTIQKLLDLMLNNFKASNAFICSFDHQNQTFSCVYESVAKGSTSVKDAIQNIDIIKAKQWTLPVIEKIPIMKDDIDDLPDYYGEHDGQIRNIRSYMAAPLISKNGVWGFLKVNITDPDRKLSYLDKESFLAVTNVIGVGLALSMSEERALQDSDFLHKLYHNMPLGYFRLRIDLAEGDVVTDYMYLDANAKFLDMIGMERENLIGKMHTDIGPIFVKKLDLQVLADVAYRGAVYETKGQFRNNSRHYNTIIYSPQYGSIVALFDDITETIITTEALKQSEEELKKVYMNIPVGIEIYDRDGYMIEVNEKELEIQDVANKEVLLGLNLFEHPSLPKFAHDLLRQGKDVTFDVNTDSMKANRRYYGVESVEKLKYLTIKCTVLYNTEGQVENYLLIVIDNTEMYDTSARLHEFESAFNSIAELAEVGFFRWNPLSNFYFNSDQWYRNMALEKREGGVLSFDQYKEIIHPDDVEVLETFITEALQGRIKKLNHAFRVKDGNSWKWLHTSCHITEYDPQNNIVEFVGINYNINELKQTEQRLIEAKSKAEESDRLKSAFLANMSHEIRTPLNAIVGFSSVLAEAEDEDEKRQFISIIEQNNDHLLKLISDILDLSKIESGTIDIVMSDINVNAICDQVTRSIAIKADKGVELDFLHNEEYIEVVIHSDMKRLTQVLSNLLTNAVKFTNKGHIWLSYKVKDDFIEFQVEDTGMGMPQEQTDAIFERFVKLNDFVQGTGLGLSICKSIVERMGGEIGVDSVVGEGSRFWFTLPMK